MATTPASPWGFWRGPYTLAYRREMPLMPQSAPQTSTYCSIATLLIP